MREKKKERKFLRSQQKKPANWEVRRTKLRCGNQFLIFFLSFFHILFAWWPLLGSGINRSHNTTICFYSKALNIHVNRIQQMLLTWFEWWDVWFCCSGGERGVEGGFTWAIHLDSLVSQVWSNSFPVVWEREMKIGRKWQRPVDISILVTKGSRTLVIELNHCFMLWGPWHVCLPVWAVQQNKKKVCSSVI